MVAMIKIPKVEARLRNRGGSGECYNNLLGRFGRLLAHFHLCCSSASTLFSALVLNLSLSLLQYEKYVFHMPLTYFPFPNLTIRQISVLAKCMNIYLSVSLQYTVFIHQLLMSPHVVAVTCLHIFPISASCRTGFFVVL